MVLLEKKNNCTRMVIISINKDGTNKPASHPDIHTLERELKKLYQDNKLAGINLYVYGLVLK